MPAKDSVRTSSVISSPRNATEHLINLFKAALATAPFCGGIASLMSDYIPSVKQRRLEIFVEELSEDLLRVQDQIDEDKFFNEEFAFVFEKCLRGVSENYQKDKLDAFRGILVNAASGHGFESGENEYYLNQIERLSTLHIKLLSFIADPEQYLAAHDIPQQRIRGGFSSFFPVAIPDVHIEAIKSAFGDLYQLGYINTDKSMFHTMTSGQGLDLLGNRITEAGRRFINFCKAPT